jgi:predicted aldo/keto reductase-like oxidoreductase
MVTSVGFGGIPIQRLDNDQAVQVVRHCLDLGVNFIDTANAYSTSEERIGQAIAGRRAVRRGSRREGLVIATKSGARDGAGVREHLALSLERLGVESIDLYQLHNVSNQEQWEKVLAPGGPLDVVREAQAAGQVRHIGITSHSMEMALQAVRSGHFETLMFPFNFITDEAAQELIPLALERDVGFIAMKPMGGGLLENAAVAFKYLRRFPQVVPVVGIEQAAEIEEIVELARGQAEMTPAEQAEMARLRAELGTRFCRRCGYCQPCPEGVAVSLLMVVQSFLKRMPLENLLGWAAPAIATADNCVKCGECEAKCPYGLPIRDMMDENVALWRAACA